MLLASRVRGIIGHVADSVLFDRDSNWDPDRYRVNWINDSNDSNSNNNVDDLTNLVDSSLNDIFRCGSKRCQFQNKFTLLIIY